MDVLRKKYNKQVLEQDSIGVLGMGIIQGLSFPFCLTVMTLSFRTDRSGQTVQTQIRLLLYSADSDQTAPRLFAIPFAPF